MESTNLQRVGESGQSGRYYDLMSLFGFSNIISGQNGYTRLQAFLEAIFEGKGKWDFSGLGFHSRYTYMTYDPPYKMIFYDINCITEAGTRVIGERALYKDNDFYDRNFTRWAYILAEDTDCGRQQPEWKSLVSINIANFVVWEDRENYIDFRDRTSEHLASDVRVIEVTIELPKFNKEIGELETELDKWLYLFKNMQYLSKRANIFDSSIFKELFEEARLPK